MAAGVAGAVGGVTGAGAVVGEGVTGAGRVAGSSGVRRQPNAPTTAMAISAARTPVTDVLIAASMRDPGSGGQRPAHEHHPAASGPVVSKRLSDVRRLSGDRVDTGGLAAVRILDLGASVAVAKDLDRATATGYNDQTLGPVLAHYDVGGTAATASLVLGFALGGS